MIGKTILHYKVLEKLGEGGMGVVYKAEDTKLKRDVAIKFLPRDIVVNDEERDRFKIEAQAAAALNHPNIATIYAIEEQDGEMFIVMEYIEGQELREIIAELPEALSLREVMDYATQIASGLHAAHEKGVVHRDIKSANIMITNKGQIKIMDFGLAKLVGGSKLTKDQSTLGTAAYMSPEQARGESVDQRSDIWSFGVVLYEMLTGELPFRGDYEQAVIYSILNEAPAEWESRVDIPRDLEEIVTKCLAKSPADRYANSALLVDQLYHLSGEVPPAPGFKRRSPAGSKEGKLPVAWLGAAGMIVLLAIVSVFFFGKEAESQERIPLAVADFVNHTGEPELDALSGMLITALEQSRKLSVMSRSRMFDVLKQIGRSEVSSIDEQVGRQICQEAGIQALVLPEIRKFGKAYSVDVKVVEAQKGSHLFARQERDEGQENIPDLVDKLAEHMRKELKEPETDIQVASTKVADVTTPNLEAYQHFFRGQEFVDKLDFGRAKEEFRRAIALDSTFALAYYRLAYAMEWFSERLATEPLNQALRLIERIPEKERYLIRAEQARISDGFGAGVAVLREMQKRYPDEKEMLFNIADWSFHAADVTTATKYFDKVLQLDPENQRARYHYGDAYLNLYMAQHSDLSMVIEKLNKQRERRPEIVELTQAIASAYVYMDDFSKAESEVYKFLDSVQSDEAKTQAKWWLSAILAYSGQGSRFARVTEENIAAELALGDTITAVLADVARGYFHAAVTRDSVWLNQELPRLSSYRARSDVPFIKQGLVNLYAAAGRVTEASAMMDALPGGPVEQVFKSMMLDECEEARKIFDQIRDLPRIPDGLKLQILFALAECQFRAGDLDEAEQSAKEALGLRVSLGSGLTLVFFRAIYYPKTYLLLGKISEARGETIEAIQYYKRFLDLWKKADADLPDLVETQRRLASLRG